MFKKLKCLLMGHKFKVVREIEYYALRDLVYCERCNREYIYDYDLDVAICVREVKNG